MSYKKNYSDLLREVKDGKYIKKNERYVLTRKNNKELYDILVSMSIKANKLFNGINNYIRNLYFNNEHIPTYKNNPEKTNFRNSLLDYMEGNHLQYNEPLKNLWDSTPVSMRKGIIYDVASLWFNREPDKIIHNRKGKNRRCSFTIKSISTIENKNFKSIKEKKSINKYKYFIKLPKNIVGTRQVFIPTNINGNSIIEIRITPNRGLFLVDICYSQYIPQKSDKNKYPKKDENIMGIDLGIENLMAVANNVNESPLLIRGKRLSAINKYYNNLIKKYIWINRNKAKKNGANKKEARNKPLSKKISMKINNLEKNRINKIHEYINKSINVLMDYAEKYFIGTIVVGINKNTNKGFQKQEHIHPIDFNFLRSRLSIECNKRNIKYVEVDESYTSSTSIFDNQLPIKSNNECYRRFSKRLYMTQNLGIINCDINSAIQIICKYNPNAFDKVFKDLGVYNLIKGTDPIHPRIFDVKLINSYDSNITYEKYRWAHINDNDEYFMVPESELTTDQINDSYEINGIFERNNIFNCNSSYHKVCIIDKTEIHNKKFYNQWNHYKLEYGNDYDNHDYHEPINFELFNKKNKNYKPFIYNEDDIRKKLLNQNMINNPNNNTGERTTRKKFHNNNDGFCGEMLTFKVPYYDQESLDIIWNQVKNDKIVKYLMSSYTDNHKYFDETGLKRFLLFKNINTRIIEDNTEYIHSKYDWDKDCYTEEKKIYHITAKVEILPLYFNEYRRIIKMNEKKYLLEYCNYGTTRREYFSKMLYGYEHKGKFNIEDRIAMIIIKNLKSSSYKNKESLKSVSVEPLLKSKQQIMGKMITPIIINISANS